MRVKWRQMTGSLIPPHLAQITDEAWNRRFLGSALRRIKPKMLRRNAHASLKLAQNHD